MKKHNHTKACSLGLEKVLESLPLIVPMAALNRKDADRILKAKEEYQKHTPNCDGCKKFYDYFLDSIRGRDSRKNVDKNYLRIYQD